ADLIGAAMGCLVLIPLLDRLGAPGVVLTAAALSAIAAALFAPRSRPMEREGVSQSKLVEREGFSRASVAVTGAVIVAAMIAGQVTGIATFDVVDTKGHRGDRVLFSKW